MLYVTNFNIIFCALYFPSAQYLATVGSVGWERNSQNDCWQSQPHHPHQRRTWFQLVRGVAWWGCSKKCLEFPLIHLSPPPPPKATRRFHINLLGDTSINPSLLIKRDTGTSRITRQRSAQIRLHSSFLVTNILCTDHARFIHQTGLVYTYSVQKLERGWYELRAHPVVPVFRFGLFFQLFVKRIVKVQIFNN